MPVKLQISGGEKYLDYAKKRLALLQAELLRQGLRTGTRHYQLADAHVEVHVLIPVDVATGQPRPERAQNRIRIEGGVYVTHYIYSPHYDERYRSSVRLVPNSAGGDEVVATGQRLLMQRLGYRARPKAVKPATEAHLLRSSSDACIALTKYLPDTLLRPSVVAVGESFFEGPYMLFNVREIDGRLRVLYKQEGIHQAFLTDYEDVVSSLESWANVSGQAPPPAVLTYRGNLAPGVREFTIGLGSYSYVHTLSFPAAAGEYAIEDAPNAPLERLDYVAYSDDPQELRIGVKSVSGSALVKQNLVTEIKLKVTFAVSPADLSLARIEAPVTLVDLKDLLSLPEEPEETEEPEESEFTGSYSQVSVDYGGYAPTFGALVLTKSVNHVVIEHHLAPPTPSFGHDFSIHTQHSEEGAVYRVRIGAGGEMEVSQVPLIPWETYVVSWTSWTGASNPPYTSYSSEYKRNGYPIVPLAHGERVEIGQVAADSNTGQFVGLNQPLSFVTTSEPISTVYGIQCGNVVVYLVLDIFWWFRDPTTGLWRVFLYEEELAAAGIQDFLPDVDGDGNDAFEVDVEYHNYESSLFHDHHGLEGQAENFDFYSESRSVSVPDVPGGILNRFDKSFHIDPQLPFVFSGLTLYWPRADGVRDGFCLLLAPSHAQFLDALRTALEIKAAGGAYQSALQAARDKLSFMVNNFATWELIASFEDTGTYYIVAK